MTDDTQHTTTLAHGEGYGILATYMGEAYHQSRYGKGIERHGAGASGGSSNFKNQQIIRGGRASGGIGPMVQVQKKSEEALGLLASGDRARARAELLGCIVYACAALDGLDNGSRWVLMASPEPVTLHEPDPDVYHSPMPPPAVPTPSIEDMLRDAKERYRKEPNRITGE